MKRLYQAVVEEHLEKHEQMVFIAGPRQVGKTTLAKSMEALASSFRYYNWDNLKHKEELLYSANKIFDEISDITSKERPIIVFDEIHKYKKWKSFIKGLYDTYKERTRIIVTGSAKLNMYKKSGDSLMGRYFLYRMHPISIGELLHKRPPEDYFLRKPAKIDVESMNQLLEFGGFPAPFLKKEKRYYNQWQALRRDQLFKEDIREISRVQDITQMEVLYQMLQEQAGRQLSYASLSKKIQVSIPTIKKWVIILEELYYCFRIKPWHKNVTRSLLKEPKLYLYDWSLIKDRGARVENYVASHLLKAVHFWRDTGLGNFGLYYLRDKEKREVDFLITNEEKPWLLVEVKSGDGSSLGSQLKYFQDQLKAPHAIQIAYEMPYVDVDFRSLTRPMIMPLGAFLSQLP